jgi:hypothetical protein
MRLYTFTVMYNLYTNIPRKLVSSVMTLIQKIVYRRYKRETTKDIAHYSRSRIAWHLIITIQN